MSPATLQQDGAAGVAIWLDFAFELAAVFFSVELQQGCFKEHLWHGDLFINGVTAAVIE